MPLPPDAPLVFDEVLDHLAQDGRLVHVEYLPGRSERLGTLARPLPATVTARLGGRPLWSHQAEALDLVRDGRSVVIATGTASGKSLCYQLAIAEAAADPLRPGTALVIVPTKALAQDQLRALTAFDFAGVEAATYDGDSSPEHRAWVRAHANVLFTNPEMVHGGLLPNHARWATFLMRLRYVVIDEVHTLRGVFGSHVAHLLRRLRRVAATYGARPTFVFTSATIGDPGRLAGGLCGLDVAEVSSDGSPAAPRVFALVNPPVVDAATGVRTSANSETAAIMTDLVRAGHRTIAFCRSRKGTELVAGDVRRRLGPAMGEKVRPYRGGYLAEERREIEAALFGGELLGVVATTALELGVDIGGLDACILDGFPGTIASMWQQAGRAGRSGRPSLAVLVAGEDQLDLWLMTHPTEVFHRPPEPAVINPSNPFVLGPHLACAAFERPLTHDDRRLWGDDLDDGVRELVQADQLRIRPPRRRGAGPSAVWAGRGVPAPRVGLRSGGGGEYRIAQADGTLVGTVDESRVHGLVHPGAVYLHQGRSWRVTELDIGLRRATVETDPGEEYTQARSDTSVRVLRVDDRRRVGRSDLFLGRLEVRSQVTGYQRREVRTRRVLGNEVLDLPPTTLRTTAFWYVLDDEVLDEAGLLAPVGVDPDAPFAGAGDAIGSALHAIEHASIGMLPLFTICDRWDVGGLSIATHPDTGGATFFIYDGYPGGTGISALGFDAADRHLDAAREVIRTCGCASGCPSCIQSPKCGNANEFLDKAGGLATLDALLGPVAGAPGVTTPAAGSTSR